ncbi:MAG: hypothetical protein GX786_10110 [Clostridiales bacterium]|nr:hypothetical protein [Clostridiales bacterium]
MSKKYFFGAINTTGKKVIVTVRKERKGLIKREAVIVQDIPSLIVVQYLKLGWKESFNKNDFIDGSVKIDFLKKGA